MLSSYQRLTRGETLVLASHNKGKLQEFNSLLSPYEITVVSAGSLNLAEPDETETTFAGNALLKAHHAAQATNLPALADDSGFCVAELDGQPGIYSARWAGPNKDFSFAMHRIHTLLKGKEKSRAWFSCVLCLYWPQGPAYSFEGQVNGTFVWPPRGDKGHGYDPVFQPEGYDKTFAEMPEAEKNALSHRFLAFAQLRKHSLPLL
ncbi:RdgB/HAM1 family non-canonical purine NTP pyrophosphatase [Entomobacter blattae]|uniref:dITP/XTP pyrophosphatase n=1 Tax=Entomobacter blattae TaxID=2762277 RepID=A0A7H1NP33_9PROT|nr:RdgB/HAM1 family non-canonical purine NTP pyrophosphatase [Entomobacter blattae]QNT77543.1 dITP/XTP pyrophosphatase [Entomobacter blattae]